MLRMHLSDRVSSEIDFKILAQRTEGYSGADLELVCREAAMCPVRRLMSKINSLEIDLDRKDYSLPLQNSRNGNQYNFGYTDFNK